jgi:hypothetical protein
MSDDVKLPTKSQAFVHERTFYKTLLLGNPNYFGTLDASPFPPVLAMSGNTYYEEIGCVGYHPQQQRLEAVVYVNQPSGYGGGLCGAGTTEFVRFYLSFDHGATWQDQGLTSFQVWDVPQGTAGAKRLEFAAQMPANPSQQLCVVGPKLILMRAILSWNAPPPPNQPNWNPPWGNRRDATIQVEPRRLAHFTDLFDALKVKVPAQLKQIIDLEQPLPLKQAALAPTALAAMYKDTVPVHRYAYPQIHAIAMGPAGFSVDQVAKTLPGLKFDAKLVELLFPKTDGDISYEELTCIGLDPNAPDTLVGVVKIKRSSGYSGGPCTAGSGEFVSWWADTDANGSFETFLGTSSVQVYDIAGIPADGVHFAVRLPVDLSKLRKPCHEGPVVLPIRAILSWAVPVPGNTPNSVPTWGNREETLVHVTPTGVVHGPAGKIAILGGIPVSMISDVTGMTTPDAVFALNNAAVGGDCPFGAAVTVQGTPLPAGYTYKVEVRPELGGVPAPVLTELTLTRSDGTTYKHNANTVTQRFAYVSFTDNVNSLLAHWDSSGDVRWIVTLSAYDPGGTKISEDSQLIQLDNTAPTVDIDITSGTGNCGKFPSGATITGTFVARDLHLLEWSIGVKPPGINDPGEGITTPSAGTTNTAIAGDPWSLDTTGMRGCGYVAEIVARDRTIVASQAQGWTAVWSVGFCLEEPVADA